MTDFAQDVRHRDELAISRVTPINFAQNMLFNNSFLMVDGHVVVYIWQDGNSQRAFAMVM